MIKKDSFSIEHKLNLLLQKFDINEKLPFYDNGKTYYVVLLDCPDYYPMVYKGMYIEFSGKYGDCVNRLSQLNQSKFVIMSETEYEQKTKDFSYKKQGSNDN